MGALWLGRRLDGRTVDDDSLSRAVMHFEKGMCNRKFTKGIFYTHSLTALYASASRGKMKSTRNFAP